MHIKKAILYLATKCIYGSKMDSNHYIKHLKSIGVSIGRGFILYDPVSNIIDEQNPRLIHIGDNVRLSHGVIILTHDYAWSVVAGKYGECLGGVAPVTIGNNVFIGMNAVITKGCVIGNNVIIGAGSIVTKNCDNDSVYAGVPARKIMTLEEYYKKRKTEQLEDVKKIIEQLSKSDDPFPYLREYCHLFMSWNSGETVKLEQDTGYYEKCQSFYRSYNRPYRDIEDLLNHLNIRVSDLLQGED